MSYMNGLAEQGRLVHQLLRDAAHVYAGSAEAPLGATGRRHHKVEHGHLGAKLDRLLGAGQTARAATDDHQVIVVVFLCERRRSKIARVRQDKGRNHGGAVSGSDDHLNRTWRADKRSKAEAASDGKGRADLASLLPVNSFHTFYQWS